MKRLTCGCCTDGCVCHGHCDIPQGLLPGKCQAHTDALNLILSHNCPNGNLLTDKGLVASSGEVQWWVLEGHCHKVHIQARLVVENPTHPNPTQRWQYEIVGVQITNDD